MNAENLKRVISGYRAHLDLRYPSIQKHNFSQESTSSGPAQIAHCLWMLDEIDKQIADGKLEEVVHNLCFIQGCTWHLGFFSLADFRDEMHSIFHA